eukprot:1421498-Pleurochrysis_carterae.AAC.1
MAHSLGFAFLQFSRQSAHFVFRVKHTFTFDNCVAPAVLDVRYFKYPLPHERLQVFLSSATCDSRAVIQNSRLATLVSVNPTTYLPRSR